MLCGSLQSSIALLNATQITLSQFVYSNGR